MTPEDLIRYGYAWNGQIPQPCRVAERRDPSDPYCPIWCPNQCTGSWKKAQCPIRLPAATKALADEYQKNRGCAVHA
jgi:hypothetical protein